MSELFFTIQLVQPSEMYTLLSTALPLFCQEFPTLLFDDFSASDIIFYKRINLLHKLYKRQEEQKPELHSWDTDQWKD